MTTITDDRENFYGEKDYSKCTYDLYNSTCFTYLTDEMLKILTSRFHNDYDLRFYSDQLRRYARHWPKGVIINCRSCLDSGCYACDDSICQYSLDLDNLLTASNRIRSISFGYENIKDVLEYRPWITQRRDCEGLCCNFRVDRATREQLGQMWVRIDKQLSYNDFEYDEEKDEYIGLVDHDYLIEREGYDYYRCVIAEALGKQDIIKEYAQGKLVYAESSKYFLDELKQRAMLYCDDQEILIEAVKSFDLSVETHSYELRAVITAKINDQQVLKQIYEKYKNISMMELIMALSRIEDEEYLKNVFDTAVNPYCKAAALERIGNDEIYENILFSSDIMFHERDREISFELIALRDCQNPDLLKRALTLCKSNLEDLIYYRIFNEFFDHFDREELINEVMNQPMYNSYG